MTAAAQVLSLISQSVLPELKRAEVQHTAYPRDRCYPVDSKPIMGFVDRHQTEALTKLPNHTSRVYVAVMHSGVTLAPTMGALAAEEIVSGGEVKDLEPYRITRDFGDWTHKY